MRVLMADWYLTVLHTAKSERRVGTPLTQRMRMQLLWSAVTV